MSNDFWKMTRGLDTDGQGSGGHGVKRTPGEIRRSLKGDRLARHGAAAAFGLPLAIRG